MPSQRFSERKMGLIFLRALVLMVSVISTAHAQTTYSGITFQDGDASFADAVVNYSPGVFPSSSPQCDTASNALGPPDRSRVSCGGYVSLGQGGSLTLSFTDPELRASGTSQPDLHIFEIGSAVELFKVEISQDGSNWINIGELSGQPSSVDIDAHPDVDAGDTFNFVRLTDLSNTNNGADIDAVGVNPQYLPPDSDAGSNQSVISEQQVSLDGSGSASGVAGVLITYAWSQVSGPSVSLSDATSAAPSFTAPTIEIAGPSQTLVFELVVTDDLGQVSEKDTVTVTVNAPSDTPPTADAGPDQSVIVGPLVTLDGSGSFDPDPGDTLTYQWFRVSGPDFELNDPTSAKPAFPSEDAQLLFYLSDTSDPEPVVLVFGLIVTDSYGETSSQSNVTITIHPVEDTPPTADAGSNQSVASGASVTLDGSNSNDPDPGDSITYLWRQISGTAVTLSDLTSAKPTFTAPTLLVTSTPVTLVFELVVTDVPGESSKPDRVTVTVNPPGDTPPTADAGSNQAVASGASVTLDGSNSNDPDPGDSITYLWRQISGTDVTLNNATSAKPTFTAPTLLVTSTPLTLVFELVVTDKPGEPSKPDRVTVTVNPPGDTPPTADAGSNQSVASGASVTLDGSNSNDPDPGDSITYLWRQISGTAVTLSDLTSAKPTFTAPTLLVTSTPLTLVFELVVTDEPGESSKPDRVTVTVNPPGDTPPTADAGSNQSVASGTSVTLDGSNSNDPDPGDSITYLWRQISGTDVTLNNATSAKPTFTAPTLLVTSTPVTLVFELVVTDVPGESSKPDRVTVTVNPPGDTPPTADAGSNQAVASGASVTLDGSNSNDPDPGDSITYLWRQISGTAVTLSDLTSAKPTFTAPTLLVTSTPVTLVFELVVTDEPGESSKPDRVTVTVNPPGDTPPTADAGSNQSVASGASVSLDGSNSNDPDPGDSITYLWRQISGTDVTLNNATSAKPTFTAPTLLVTSTPVTLVFELVVTDEPGESSKPDRVTVTVNPPGDTPPTADAGSNQAVASGASVSLDGSNSNDPDPGDSITYLWRQISGTAVTLSDLNSAKPTFTAPTLLVTSTPVTLVFELVVTDEPGESSKPDRVTVTVNPPGDTPPTADIIAPNLIKPQASVVLDGSGSFDPDVGDQITYMWRQISGPAVTLDDVNAIRPEFAAPELRFGDDPVSLVFELVVTDLSGNASEPKRIFVLVEPPDQPPPLPVPVTSLWAVWSLMLFAWALGLSKARWQRRI